MSPRRTPVLDLAGDPERLAAIVAAPRRADAADAALVSGTLPNGRRVYGWYARDVVERQPAGTQAARPVPAAPAPPPPSAAVDPSAALVTAIAANLARTPVRVGSMLAPTGLPPAPAARMSAERRRALLSCTPAGQEILARERRAADCARSRQPAPISPAARHALGTTDLGRRALADRAERDPAGEAAARERAGGLGERRRRELLGRSGAGRALLAGRDRRRRD